MSTGRFKIVFEKLAEAAQEPLRVQPAGGGEDAPSRRPVSVAEIRELCQESDEIDELRRLALLIEQPEERTFTVG